MASPDFWHSYFVGRYSVFMVAFLVAILIGSILGYFSGLGIGGGSLLIIWLTAAIGIPQQDARTINLMYFVVCAGAVTYFRLRKGKLQFRKWIPGIIAGCISAALFSWIGLYLDTDLLRKVFGTILIVVGMKELFHRPRKFK